MRNNQPVNDNEVLLTSEHLIVSKTDLKGIITYVNRDFVEISGYSEEELIGQPHNLIRHPDMPSEAFADLWRDLQARRPWVGLVKNRRKDGGFYWVAAAVAPLYENGKVTGYMSVRRQASREQIMAADSAYQRIREGRAGRLRIRHGAAVEGGRAGSQAGPCGTRSVLDFPSCCWGWCWWRLWACGGFTACTKVPWRSTKTASSRHNHWPSSAA